MFGLFLGLAYAGYQYLIGVNPLQIYQSTTGFLYGWYIWTTVLIGIIIGVVALVVPIFLGAGGASQGGILGGLLGFLAGGALSALMIVVVAISRGCLIIGTLLLTQAMVLNAGVPSWDTIKLIFGGLLVLVGLITGRSSSSSKDD